MSAFMCSDRHISALVRYACRANLSFYVPAEHGRSVFRVPGNEQQVCDMLASENLRSVNYRYDDTQEFAQFEYDTGAPILSDIEALKLAQCLEYQSCEHPAWEKSGSRSFCLVVISHAIRHLPGYSSAAWAI